MKKLIASLLLFVASSTFAGQIDRLTQAGCDFLAVASACMTDEVNKKVEAGFCKKSVTGVMDGLKAQQPDNDFSLAEKLLGQEMDRVKSTKSKDAQKVFNTVQDKCYAVGGDIKQLLNKEL